MLFGCAGAAVAETVSDDQALMAVTAKVKATLDLDTELYDDFQGQSSQDVLLGTRWQLEWNGDGRSLNISADDTGKIYSYYYSYAPDEEPVVRNLYAGGRLQIPSLPEDKSQAAYATAVDFLNKVLVGPVESVELENTYRPSLNQSSYRYSGTVLLNGLESPISCSVTVRASDLAVTRFWRGDEGSGYLGGVPGAETSVGQDKARSSLRSTLELKPKYVLQEDGKTARVQYVPVYGDDYYVDGATGELVNLTELRQKLWRNSAGGVNRYFTTEAAADAAAPEASMKNALTKAEQDGAAILAGALEKEELDRVVKAAWPEMGLEKYTLAAADYSITEKEIEKGAERTPEDYNVTCRLTYGRQIEGGTANKYVTVDAKTGALKSLSSGRYYQEKWPESIPATTSLTNAQATAEKALASFAGANFAKLGLFETENAKDEERSWQHTFTFQQTANGYFYDGNAYTVGVDATDGTLSTLRGSFDEKVELVTPSKVIDPAAAATAYANALELRYGYLEVPVSISLAGPQVMPLLKEAGYEYVNALKTGFVLEQPKDQYVSAVDAETGEAVIQKYNATEEPELTYDDVEGHWVKDAAQALALFQVGFRGGSLKPAEALTQRDMIALLLSVEGYSFDPTGATKEDVDALYSMAYAYGLVTPETRSDDAAVTRGGLVKALLDAAGYEKIAAIPGIFRCDYADAASITAQDMGYAALAQGLGLVKGGDQGEYAATRAATRAEAVAMLYQYMK